MCFTSSKCMNKSEKYVFKNYYRVPHSKNSYKSFSNF